MITYKSACELAHNFPGEIGAFLDLEAGLHGGHFGEETVTDLFMAALLKLPGLGVIVQKPDEPTTGGDMDWIIYDQTNVCGYRVQSKRLSCTTKKWKTYSFKHLAHPNDTGAQSTSLIDVANLDSPMSMYPLYCFYSPNIAVRKSGYAFKAIMLADGFYIAQVIQGIVNKTMITQNDRRISHLLLSLFDLSVIFCPRTQQTPRTSSLDGLATPLESNTALLGRVDAGEAQSRLPVLTPRSDQMAEIIDQAESKLASGQRLQEVKGLKRPRAFLRAG